jgi:hypothetical protein
MDYETVRKLFDYDPDTGRLTWKVRTAIRVRIGDEAGTADYQGYRKVGLKGKEYYAHRLAWLWMTGEWPEVIDHINHDKLDNRWCNLRDVGYEENNKNKAKAIGVCWYKDRNMWRSYITVDSNRIDLGSFEDKEEAIAARRAALVEYGFHSNHGSI